MHKNTKMTSTLVAHLGRCQIFFQTESFSRLWWFQVLELIHVVRYSVGKEGGREEGKGGKRARSPKDSPAHLRSHN